MGGILQASVPARQKKALRRHFFMGTLGAIDVLESKQTPLPNVKGVGDGRCLSISTLVCCQASL